MVFLLYSSTSELTKVNKFQRSSAVSKRTSLPSESIRGFINNNIVKFYIDKQLDPASVDKIIRKLVSIKPVEFTLEYDYSEMSKFNAEEALAKDFNISVENSISEFIDLLDIKHKDTVKTYVTDLYHKAQTNL